MRVGGRTVVLMVRSSRSSHWFLAAWVGLGRVGCHSTRHSKTITYIKHVGIVYFIKQTPYSCMYFIHARAHPCGRHPSEPPFPDTSRTGAYRGLTRHLVGTSAVALVSRTCGPGGFIPTETLVWNGTAGNNGTAGGTLNPSQY